MRVRFPADATTPAQRLRHVQRLRERARRWNNARTAAIAAARGIETASRWHRQWFLPRSHALTAAELRLRRRVHGPWRPSDPEAHEEPPWLAERVRVRRLRDGDPELAGIDPNAAFEGTGTVAAPPDPTEDYTTYTENDPNNRLTVTASNIAISGLLRTDTAQVYTDKGAAHFGATFEHNFDARITVDVDGHSYPWVVTNTLDVFYNLWNNQDEAICIRMTGYGTRAYIFVCKGQSSDYSPTAFPLNTWKYLTVERTSETAVECRIYSDAARTSLDDTISATVTSGERYRYMMGMNSHGAGTAASISGDAANLDLQEAGAGLSIPVSMHHYRQMRA